MQRIFLLTCVSAMLLFQLTLLPTRGFIKPWPPLDPPATLLPAASNGQRPSCHGIAPITVSLSRNQLWILDDVEIPTNDEFEQELRMRAERMESRGYRPSLRTRIEASAPARYFIALTHLAESCGIERVSVAVLQPDAVWW